MKDEFKYLRFARHGIYQLLSLFNRLVWMFLPRSFEFHDKERLYDFESKSDNNLLIYRDFNASNVHALSNIGLNLSEVLHVRGMGRLTTKVRVGNVFLGNAAWTRRQIIENDPNCVFIADPQLIGIPGPVGLLQCLFLVSLCKRMKCRLILVLFDLPDPQGSLFGSILSRLGAYVMSICNDPSESLAYSNIKNAIGPAGEICHRLHGSTLMKKISERTIDVHLPRPSYSPRKEVVEETLPILLDKNLKVTVGGTYEKYDDLVRDLYNTKIIVVTNSLISGCVGRWPLPDGPNSHIVSYNYEALRSGALLLSEATKPMGGILKDGIEYQSFEDAKDLINKISFFTENLDVAERIAIAGSEKYAMMVKDQAMIHALLDRN